MTKMPMFPSEKSRSTSQLVAALRAYPGLSGISKFEAEDQSKLLVLCRHYGIQVGPVMFNELALALARVLYPEPKKRGRKLKWTLLHQGMLVVEIERLAKPDDPQHGVDWACQQIAKREPWKSFLESNKSVTTTSPDPAEALRVVYYKFRTDEWATVMRDAFKSYKGDGALERWEKFVFDLVKNSHPK